VRREARDALRDSERAISEANRKLARAAADGARLRAQAAHIAERRRVLERTAAERQAAVERMLAARHAAGAPDALRVALSGADPASLGRTLQYVGYVSRAAAALIGSYRDAIAELAELARAAAEREAGLREVERAIRGERERIVRERASRRRVLARLAGEIRKNRRELGALKADESRLARLVQRLIRIVEAVPEPGAARAPFSKLRGSLRLPVRGELTGRFGAPRGAAGIEAKGVFIRAPEGQPVRAVAGGQVVYADWMRGFGNLLIVDHGESYLSIYANNESLLKQVGDTVSTGEPVATTGSSGGNEETGLYFELRHLGRAFDPLRWVKLK
jgi:septal ring factor EnvC (AmiA/AmiB activator)